MERAALIGGIVLAVFVVLIASVHKHISIDLDDKGWEGFHRAAYVEPAPASVGERVYNVTAARVRDAAAIVRVIPEDRANVAIAIENPGHAPTPVVEQREGEVIVDGRMARRIHGCRSDGSVRLDGYGALSRAELPTITIRTPRDVTVKLGGAVQAEIGPAQTVDLAVSG